MVSSRCRMKTTTAARHADPAEQQRDEADQPEVAGEPAERVVQVRLVLGDRADPHPLGQEHGPVALGERLRRRRSAGSRTNASYSAREPKPSRRVAGRSRAAM